MKIVEVRALKARAAGDPMALTNLCRTSAASSRGGEQVAMAVFRRGFFSRAGPNAARPCRWSR
jgi:hypothetical protein